MFFITEIFLNSSDYVSLCKNIHHTPLLHIFSMVVTEIHRILFPIKTIFPDIIAIRKFDFPGGINLHISLIIFFILPINVGLYKIRRDLILFQLKKKHKSRKCLFFKVFFPFINWYKNSRIAFLIKETYKIIKYFRFNHFSLHHMFI